ncbi:transcription termination/antitermination protein NusG, partial [Myxococcota bacterium]
NDHIDMGRQLQEEKAQKRRQALGYNPGDKVRIISGVFAGKTGVVQNIDTKAQVKVQVGKMSLVVSGSDLTPVG